MDVTEETWQPTRPGGRPSKYGHCNLCIHSNEGCKLPTRENSTQDNFQELSILRTFFHFVLRVSIPNYSQHMCVTQWTFFFFKCVEPPNTETKLKWDCCSVYFQISKKWFTTSGFSIAISPPNFFSKVLKVKVYHATYFLSSINMKNIFFLPDVVRHIYNPSIWKAEGEELPQVQGQTELQRETVSNLHPQKRPL